MNSTEKHCRYSERQIEESGLLSDERFREVQAAVTERITPAYDRDGKPVGQSQIVHLNDGVRWLHPRVDSDHSAEYVRTQALVAVLTDDELETINAHCLEAWRIRREATAFEKAKKVTEWSEGAWLGDDYYHSMDDLICFLEDNEGEWPEYVWAAKPQRVIGEFTVFDICESYIDANGWEEMDESDLHGVDELKAALDKFTEANAGVLSYQTDYKVAVLLEGYKSKVTTQP